MTNLRQVAADRTRNLQWVESMVVLLQASASSKGALGFQVITREY
jgi:hypothetical protein